MVCEDDPTGSKNRPVLVVRRDRRALLGLMPSSQHHPQSDPDWVGIGAGSWDYQGRPNWVQLDRLLGVPEEGIRREGAILGPRSRRRRGPVTRRLLVELNPRRPAWGTVNPG